MKKNSKKDVLLSSKEINLLLNQFQGTIDTLVKAKMKNSLFAPYALSDGRYVLVLKASGKGVVYPNKQFLEEVVNTSEATTQHKLLKEMYPFGDNFVDMIRLSQVELSDFFDINKDDLDWTLGSLSLIDKKLNLVINWETNSDGFFIKVYPLICLYASEVCRMAVDGEWLIEHDNEYSEIILPKIINKKGEVFFPIPRIYDELKERTSDASIQTVVDSELYKYPFIQSSSKK